MALLYGTFLNKHNMKNIVAVVTRYFGGIKLGVRGLIDAYFESVDTCLLNTELKKYVEYSNYEIKLSYGFFETFKHNIKIFDLEIKNIVYLAMRKQVGIQRMYQG